VVTAPSVRRHRVHHTIGAAHAVDGRHATLRAGDALSVRPSAPRSGRRPRRRRWVRCASCRSRHGAALRSKGPSARTGHRAVDHAVRAARSIEHRRLSLQPGDSLVDQAIGSATAIDGGGLTFRTRNRLVDERSAQVGRVVRLRARTVLSTSPSVPRIRSVVVTPPFGPVTVLSTSPSLPRLRSTVETPPFGPVMRASVVPLPSR
jgi:hypothetical protein